MKLPALSIVLASLLFFLMALAGQQGPPLEARPGEPQFGHQPQRENPAWTRDQLKQMQKQQKAARQKQLKEDTEKLLQLATELKESVEKTNENVLSLDVVKKAEEIEKLAKHIKTNMRDEVR
jgi:hypothetical protein